MNNKFFSILVIIGGLFLFTCFWADAIGDLEQTKKIIKVGTYENLPKVYTTVDGKVTGFFPAILEHIAEAEGWQIEYRHGTWQECMDRLESAEIDIMMDVALSAERQEKFDFNDETVLISWAAIYTRPDVNVQSFFDLSGRRIAVMKGSIYTVGTSSIQELLSQLGITADYLEYPSYQDVFKSLAVHEADAGVVNNIFGAYFEKEYNVVRSPMLFGPSQLRFAFTKNAPLGKQLAPILDARLRALKQDLGSFYYAAIDTYLYGTPHKEDAQGQVDWKAILSEEERIWIQEHPEIRLGIDPEFYPFEFRDEKGRYQGIASDYVRILNERLGLNMRMVEGITWTDAVAGIQHGQIDVLPCVGFTEERSKFAVFSKPYIQFQRVILTRIDMPFVTGLRDIESMRVGVQAGSSHEGFLRDHSSIKPSTYATLEDCLLALSAGNIDAVVTNLASSAYWIRKLNLINLKVAAPASSEVETLYFAIRKDWPELAMIINKGLNLVTADEQRMVEQRWVAVEYKPGIEPRVIWRIGLRIAAAVILILATTLIWTYKLEKEIGRRKKVEQMLAIAKNRAETADRAKSDFLANMSHELRTPLNSIIGFAELLQDELFGTLNEKQHQYIDNINLSGKHLLSLINDILDLSKVESGKMELELEKLSFKKDVLEPSLTILLEKATKHNIKLDLEVVPDADMELIADVKKLKQIMFNLLSNAIKFTPDGGSVHVFVKRRNEPSEIEVSVKDTGIGIKSEDMHKLFKTFTQIESTYTKNYEGTGLGLALTKELVALHGGRIWAESEGEGRGSKFIFTIPLRG